MKKLTTLLIAACLSSLIFGQEIPEIIVSTNRFQKEFHDIRKQTYNDNIIGKKIKIESAITKSTPLLLKEGNYYVCQTRITTDVGLGIVVYFNKLVLPPGSSIMAYSDNEKQKVGPFHENNNTMTNAFALPLINNNAIIVEAKVPISKYTDFEMDISEIGCVVMSGNDEKDESFGFGETESCYVNVNCSDGEPWTDQKRSVVRYTYTKDDYIGNCTGALVNNTAQDDRNFFLTAQHCAMGASADELGQVIFYFNYESPTCDNPQNDDGLLEETVIGCTRIAVSGNSSELPPEGSDFQLLEINPIPASYNVYYAGWNRNDLGNLSGPGSIIQHPLSDIKKISFVSEFSEAATYSDLYAMTMTTPSGEGGNVEPNSSGSPIFDNMKLVVGTISYGSIGCVTSVDPDNVDLGAGGRFYYHWDKNGTENDRKLSPWLDPLNTGVMTFEGKNSSSVGVDELQINASLFNVIPNPANNFVTVKSNLAITKILFYSIDGKLLLTTDKSETIDISKLPTGLIIIKIYSENGKIAHSKMYKQ